jgi:hypothetical protein
MFREEFEQIKKASEKDFESQADKIFLARRGCSAALNRKFVLSANTELNLEDFYIHMLAKYFAGMATRVCFYDEIDMFAYHSLQSNFENILNLWILINRVLVSHSDFSVRLMDSEELKCVYKFENRECLLDSVFATAIFCDRFQSSTLDFKVGESFLAGAGNSLVAPKF